MNPEEAAETLAEDTYDELDVLADVDGARVEFRVAEESHPTERVIVGNADTMAEINGLELAIKKVDDDTLRVEFSEE